MRRQLTTALLVLLLFTGVTGIVYPLAMTAVAQVGFSDRANGALVEQDGEVVGSSLIAQSFDDDPQYLQPRPSDIDYDATDSGGANYGPTNPDLLANVAERAAAYRELNGLPEDAEVPIDAVTGSASGLDPHISPANAQIQAPRVAGARGLTEQEVLDVIEGNTAGRGLGFLGEASVNVLDVNLALDMME